MLETELLELLLFLNLKTFHNHKQWFFKNLYVKIKVFKDIRLFKDSFWDCAWQQLHAQ